jgi:hypothetical protein
MSPFAPRKQRCFRGAKGDDPRQSPGDPGITREPLPGSFIPPYYSAIRVFVLIFGLCLATAATKPAAASSGPESVLLVANPRSLDSISIANYYAERRHIPARNYLFLDWDPKQETTDVDTFRKSILLPVIKAAKLPVPGRQIDYVVYSSDFPWGIRIDEDIKKFTAAIEKQGQSDPARSITKSKAWGTFTPVASINGLTYLWEMVMTGDFYIKWDCNWYARTGATEQAAEPTLGFSSATAFGPRGEAGTGSGRHYMLSMVLGVTAGRGNTRAEVLNYLNRSAKADGTRPPGTIYFMRNDDIRSKVRQDGFADAVAKLKAVGVSASVLAGNVPEGKNDVQGAMLGVADFDWKASHSTILPGAICEHFTSFGGEMHANAGQTPLSVWLRNGATASSGAVTEPYAIRYKFPLPMMQVHYARGCTVAESFYQAVQGPYQLLIVGDPLCRPWAKIPEITVTGLTAGQIVRGKISIQPTARFPGEVKAEHFNLFLDGQKVRDCLPEGTLEFDTAPIADGAHELRVVAESKGPLPSRGEKIIPCISANHGQTIQVSCKPSRSLPLKKSLVISAKSPKSKSIRVFQGMRMLGTIKGGEGHVEIPAATLGLGPVQLQVVGVGDVGPESSVYASPLSLVVEE